MALSTLFFFGTLRHAPLLAIVLGRSVTCEPATLPGYAVRRAAGGDYPVLHVQAGAQAAGVLVRDLTKEDLARLDYYEGGFAYHLEAMSVQVRDAFVSAQVYVAPDVRPSTEAWELAEWVATHGPMTLEAAPEIMRAYTRGEPVSDLATRVNMIRARAHAAVSTRVDIRPLTVGHHWTSENVTVHRTDHPYEAFFRVDDLTLSHSTHHGGQIGPLRRAVFNVCDAATVLLYDTLRDRVLLLEQLRIGALARHDPQPWMLEPVAGMIDAGETPEATAVREAHEEAGIILTRGDLHHVASYYPTPGAVAQRLHSYVATCDLPDSVTGVGGEVSENEDIRTHVVSFDALMGMLASGEAANAPLILSAQWLALHRTRLRGPA